MKKKTIIISIITTIILIPAIILIFIYANLGKEINGHSVYNVGAFYENKNVNISFNYVEYKEEQTSFYFVFENKKKVSTKIDETLMIVSHDISNNINVKYEYNIFVDGKNESVVQGKTKSIVVITIEAGFINVENNGQIDINIYLYGINFMDSIYGVEHPFFYK